MRILFVGTNLPIPANNGQAIRTLSVVQALASLGHEVTFTSFAARSHADSLQPLSSWCREIEVMPQTVAYLSQHTSYFRRAMCFLQSKPYSVERFRSRQMQTKIRRLLEKSNLDLIVADGIYALVNIPQTNVSIALNCHNVEHVIVQRYAAMERNLPKRRYAAAEARWIKEVEREACERVSVAMVCSSTDRELLQEFRPELPVFVVPNSVDTDLYTPNEIGSPDENAPVLLFQGAMDWYPNRDAVEFFVNNIFPFILKQFPSARFVVAGRNPPPEFVKRLEVRDSVEFTGTVPDMRPYLSSATLVVVPLRLGSGTRIKILEACAAGKAVVSTKLGAEGLDLVENKEIILAEEAAEFGRAVTSLLEDPAQRAAIARAGRAKIIERYSHLALKRTVDDVVSHLLHSNEPAMASEAVR